MLNSDAQSILLLCSHLSLPDGGDVTPFGGRDWMALRDALNTAEISPGALLGMNEDQLASVLNGDGWSHRVAQLFNRADSLIVELQRLKDLGIWILTSVDEHYPQRYHQRLGSKAPPVLFGAGDRSLLSKPGLAVVGSRHASESSLECATQAGRACAQSGHVVFTGGAKGVDAAALTASLDADGSAVVALADGLEKTMRSGDIRRWLDDDHLTLVTPYSPSAGFSVGAAMGRNRLIYTLADFALVVSSEAEKGGTWAGATEALKAKWCPVFVLDSDDAPEGNRRLLKKGGLAFPSNHSQATDLWSWLGANAKSKSASATQESLF